MNRMVPRRTINSSLELLLKCFLGWGGVVTVTVLFFDDNKKAVTNIQFYHISLVSQCLQYTGRYIVGVCFSFSNVCPPCGTVIIVAVLCIHMLPSWLLLCIYFVSCCCYSLQALVMGSFKTYSLQ